jgi:hypothetical protein
MTGNFKLRTVENDIDTHGKWIVHEKNIDRRKKKFYNMKDYNRLTEDKPLVENLSFFGGRGYSYCPMYEHDIIRKLNIEEYFILEHFLRRLGRRYNKKQDKLIQL